MQQEPPILTRSDVPPRLAPVQRLDPRIGWLYNCKAICAVATVLFLGAVAVGFGRFLSGEQDRLGLLCFGVALVILALCATVLLHQRKHSGYLPAVIVLIVLLPGLPLGTIMGIMGLHWLSKSKTLLTRG